MSIKFPSLSVSSETVKTARDVAIVVATTAATVAAVALPIFKVCFPFLLPFLLAAAPWLLPVVVIIAAMGLTYGAYRLHEYISKPVKEDAVQKSLISEDSKKKVEDDADFTMDEIPQAITVKKNLQETKPFGAVSDDTSNSIWEIVLPRDVDELKKVVQESLKDHQNHMNKQRIHDGKIAELSEEIDEQGNLYSSEQKVERQNEKKRIKKEFNNETKVFNKRWRERIERYPVIRQFQDVAENRMAAEGMKVVLEEQEENGDPHLTYKDYDEEALKLIIERMSEWTEWTEGAIHRVNYEGNRLENAVTPSRSPEIEDLNN